MAHITRRDLLITTAAAGVMPGATAEAATPTGVAASALSPIAVPRGKELLDFGWRFHLGNANNPEKDFGYGRELNTYAKAGLNTADAARLDFDDSGWTAVDLPHDWAVELPFVPSAGADAAKENDPKSDHGYKPLGRGYPETSIGWYRRSFDIPADDLGRRIFVEFEGAFRDALVMFNGYIVGRNEDGYVPFAFDVSDFANYGGKNVLTVRVDATLGEGWFYEGAGIYRHVWLVKKDPLHIPQDGVCVRATPKNGGAAIALMTEIANHGDTVRTCRLVSTIRDPQSNIVAVVKGDPVSVDPGAATMVRQDAVLSSAALWSLETPQLYRVSSEIFADGRSTDETFTDFGIRDIRFDPDKGFFLNGEPVKLKGTCNHQDHAGVGSALPDKLHEWRIARLKEMGSNAYRTSHNPPAPALLHACDRLGMLVLDETRRMSSDPESMDSFARMIRRDRNHPSIIAWSIGNEEQGQQGTERGARIARSMKRLANELDPTRPITAAMDGEWGKGISPVLDIVGFNYRTPKMVPFHKLNPNQPVMGTETGSTVATRGVYVKDPSSGYCVAYDTEFPWWASTAEAWWAIAGANPFIAGGFVWTGFDYRGEPTPFNKWPNVASQFGIMDSCGFAKDNFYYYKAMWGSEPVLHLFPHWNWSAGRTVKVWAHTNLPRLELFLNGKSLGARSVPRFGHAEWNVAFAPGVIEARGYDRNGKLVLTQKRETVGAPSQIALSPDRASILANAEDVAVVAVAITDAQGCVVPTADNLVTFDVSGSGRLIGVGNGDPRSHESDKAPHRRAFNGLCVAIIQATRNAGPISISASSDGLTTATATIQATAAQSRPFVR